MKQGEHLSDREPGATLRETRLAAGLSAESVAEDLNLLVYHVEALEENDYSRFNADIFVRGHVRSYARLLDLPPAPLLKAAEQRLRDTRGQKESRTTSAIPGDRYWRPVLALLAALIIWVVAVLTLGHSEPEEFRVEELPGLVDPLPFEVVNALGAELLARANGSAGGEAAELERHSARLSLDFARAVWVQVVNADGDVLLSGVQSAGQQVELTAVAPFELVLAYWPAVSVKFNGQVVPVGQFASGNATRLRLTES